MESSISPDRLEDVLPPASAIEKSQSALFRTIPIDGLGFDRAVRHLRDDIVPGLNKSSQNPHYYGFVTGGATPAAVVADNLVSDFDQNVMVHLPKETVATNVEDSALRMVCDLLDLPQDDWPHRTFTTGATSSNLIGLGCGREFALQSKARSYGRDLCVGEKGIYQAMKAAQVDDIQILSTVAHSCIAKAASILGLGRSSLHDLGRPDERNRFDLDALRAKLADPTRASIVVISASEVNTGLFATSKGEMQTIRDLCTEYGAWLHVDAAFGLLARLLPRDSAEYSDIAHGVDGLQLADSIAGDAHKLLNVPYDCGIFLSRHLQIGLEVFQNANAAYLDVAGSADPTRFIPPPLNIGIENSRRFRALPVYATLTAYGLNGYRKMLERQISLAREIAQYLHESPQFELLPPTNSSEGPEDYLRKIYVIVLFRAVDEKLNQELVKRINSKRRIYVSGTQWNGKSAARFAVANWQVNVKRDFALIKEVLSDVSKP